MDGEQPGDYARDEERVGRPDLCRPPVQQQCRLCGPHWLHSGRSGLSGHLGLGRYHSGLVRRNQARLPRPVRPADRRSPHPRRQPKDPPPRPRSGWTPGLGAHDQIKSKTAADPLHGKTTPLTPLKERIFFSTSQSRERGPGAWQRGTDNPLILGLYGARQIRGVDPGPVGS